MEPNYEAHYIHQIWNEIGWESSAMRLKGLTDHLTVKQRNIHACQQYYDTGAYLKAKRKYGISNSFQKGLGDINTNIADSEFMS